MRRSVANTYIAAGIVGLLTLTAQAEAQSTFTLTASGAPNLTNSGTPGNFTSGDIALGIQTNSSRWKLYVSADPVTGPGISKATYIKMGVKSTASGIAVAYPDPFALDAGRQLATGGPISNPTALTFRLSIELPPYTTAGNYSTTIRFTADTGNGNGRVPVATIPVTFTIEPFVSIKPTGNNLTFSTTDIADYVASPTSFVIGTNAPAGADVTIQVNALTGPGGAAIPISQIGLAYETTQSLARTAGAAAPLGTTTCHLQISRGEKTYFVTARLLPTYGLRPGIYAGTITVSGVSR